METREKSYRQMYFEFMIACAKGNADNEGMTPAELAKECSEFAKNATGWINEMTN